MFDRQGMNGESRVKKNERKKKRNHWEEDEEEGAECKVVVTNDGVRCVAHHHCVVEVRRK